MKLALEGERLCRAGDCRAGVRCFEAAISVGTSDLRTLSAIYSQLGNAYFCLRDYAHSLNYHRHDVKLARTIGDKAGEAKASGNLGNTLKLLGKFDEAAACCQRQFDIYTELSDSAGVARALYNLGNIYHAHGKQRSRGSANHEPGKFSADALDLLQKAVNYYNANLDVVRELNDRVAEGRACGNLGNTHYLLGNFSLAVSFHQERLLIAKLFGDKSAERRAYSNLGNAHIFLGNFTTAADFYQQTLVLAMSLGDRALEAQACYSLGNTYTLLRQYERSVEYHTRHLHIARELTDSVGEARACWSLGNAYSALQRTDLALHYTTLHLDLSRQIEDAAVVKSNAADAADVQLLGDNSCPDVVHVKRINSCRQPRTKPAADDSQLSRARRKSMEKMELVKLTTPDKRRLGSSSDVETGELDQDGFFEMLSRHQGRRIDDQRCCLLNTAAAASGQRNKENIDLCANSHVDNDDEFLDMIASIQGSRMDDQRADATSLFPGLHSSPAVMRQMAVAAAAAASSHGGAMMMMNTPTASILDDDQFFETLMRCQGARIEEQRSVLPTLSSSSGPSTVPDEDIISVIVRYQSNRLEEQRSSMPPPPSL